VDVAEARDLLGVGATADDAELRRAYRQALRRTHPDLPGGTADATRRVVAAYRLLAEVPATSPASGPTAARASAAAAGPRAAPPSAAASPPSAVSVTVDGDTVAADLPAGDLLAMLHEVGHRIGDVTFVDRESGLLEVVVTFEGYGPCSVVLTLQGRSAGLTEAFCTVEPLAGGPSPPAEAVAELLASGLRHLT
jgi:curved DNA-binding protein